MNVDELVAIDVHTHAMVSHEHANFDDDIAATNEAAKRYFRTAGDLPSLDEIAAYYRERHMACVVFPVDNELEDGQRPVGNEEVLAAGAAHPDVLIPFVSIDPHRGAVGVREARRLVRDFDVRGFKLHPNTQHFFPNDRLAYPLYEVIEESGLPVVFHTGHTGIGAGARGGAGIRLKFSNPMHVDDVAVDFPDLTIILAHPSFPWQDEAISVALHKHTVSIDLSGWSPKYFPPQLVQYANTLLKDRVLFGSDYPLITPDRWLADFAELNIRDEVRPLILKENAVRLLRLGDR